MQEIQRNQRGIQSNSHPCPQIKTGPSVFAEGLAKEAWVKVPVASSWNICRTAKKKSRGPDTADGNVFTVGRLYFFFKNYAS